MIVEAALRNRCSSFLVDGEAVLLGVDGISDFDGLHSRKHNDEVQLSAFDILMIDGDDLRRLPLHLRKTNLAPLLARRPQGIFVSDFEQGEIGPDLFRHACKLGLVGLVSKRRGQASTAPAGRRTGSRSRTGSVQQGIYRAVKSNGLRLGDMAEAVCLQHTPAVGASTPS